MTKEKLVKVLFRNKYPNDKVFYNYRPDWLRNPATGYPLELDIYYPELKFAIEIQGIHHELNYQSYKDRVKQDRCYQQGIILHSLPLKKKALLQLLKLYQIEIPKELRMSVKWFASGHPRKNSKMYAYYTDTIKQIKKEKMLNWQQKQYHWNMAQQKERDFNKRLES